MSHLYQKHQQKAQQIQNCESTPRCGSDCKDNKVDRSQLSRPITRSTFRDPLLGCHSTEEGSCTCSYWKRKYLANNLREKSQVEGCCQIKCSDISNDFGEHGCWEIPTNACQCEGPLNVMDEGCFENSCKKKNPCENIKSCLRDASSERAIKCCEDLKEKSKFLAVNRADGKVVLNFNVNLTPQLTNMLKRIL